MKFYDGYEHISVKLINFAGNDLARQVVLFGNLGEMYEGIDKYSENDKKCQQLVDDIIHGRTFPKYAFEGHNVAFQINEISRICLAQITREKGFFCSASGGVRPLTQTFITPKNIYNNTKWMSKLKHIQKEIEDVYIEMCEAGIPYVDSRYFGFHGQTISLCYTANIINWTRSCNSRTDNSFSDEINYVYRLMLFELKKAIKEQVKDKLSLKLWNWLLSFADKKTFSKDYTYCNDFERYKAPKDFFDEPAHNDWRKSSWKLELEKMYKERPELLLDGEKEMIERWQKLEQQGKTLPATYDSNFIKSPEQAIKGVYYYDKRKRQ